MAPVPLVLRPGEVKEAMIKRLLDFRCEICGEQLPKSLLEVHYIPGPRAFEGETRELQEGEILILCSGCHRDLHAFAIGEEEQARLLGFRSREIRQKISRILKKRLTQVQIPEQDLEGSVRDAFPPHWGWGT